MDRPTPRPTPQKAGFTLCGMGPCVADSPQGPKQRFSKDYLRTPRTHRVHTKRGSLSSCLSTDPPTTQTQTQSFLLFQLHGDHPCASLPCSMQTLGAPSKNNPALSTRPFVPLSPQPLRSVQNTHHTRAQPPPHLQVYTCPWCLYPAQGGPVQGPCPLPPSPSPLPCFSSHRSTALSLYTPVLPAWNILPPPLLSQTTSSYLHLSLKVTPGCGP